jgi:hypothetical protein
MRVAGAVAAALGAAALIVLGGAQAAGACSIVTPGPSEQELLDQADVVFQGVALTSEDPNAGAPVHSSGDPIAWTFTVEQVVKGVASATQQVTTARSGATCGFTFVEGHRYVVYARAVGGVLSTSLFSGTREGVIGVTTTTATTPPPDSAAPPPFPTTTLARRPLVRTGFSGARAACVALLLVGAGLGLAAAGRRGPGDRGGA